MTRNQKFDPQQAELYTPDLFQLTRSRIPEVTPEIFTSQLLNIYSTMNHPWHKAFSEYQSAHVMRDVMERLRSGLDDVSLRYIENHETIMSLCRFEGRALYPKELMWTDEDRRLLQRYKDLAASGSIPLLNTVGFEWGSNICNMYGMYDLPEKTLAALNGRDVIDGGGYIGDTIHVMRMVFPKSHVHIFEPSPENLERMFQIFGEENIEKDPALTLNRIALGSSAGFIDLNSDTSGVTAAASTVIRFDSDRAHSRKVAVTTIDAYVTQNDLHPGVIKLDVEGAEPDILKGALETVRKHRPVLLLAHYHTPEEFYELKPYIEDLNLDYDLRIRRSNFTLPVCDIIIVATPRELL